MCSRSHECNTLARNPSTISIFHEGHLIFLSDLRPIGSTTRWAYNAEYKQQRKVKLKKRANMDFKLHPLNIKFQNLTYRVSKNNGKYVHTIDSPYKLHPCTLRHLIRSAFVDFSMSNFYLNLNFYETWKTKCRRNRCPAAISSSQACDVGCEKRKSEKNRMINSERAILPKWKYQCQLSDYCEHASIFRLEAFQFRCI